MARVLAAGGPEDEVRALRSFQEDDSGAPDASLFASESETKIEQPLHESQTGEEKIEQPLDECQAGKEKVEQPLDEFQASEKKIEQPLHEFGIIGVTISKSTFVRKIQLRSPVFGTTRRELASRVSRCAAQADAEMADPTPRALQESLVVAF